MKDKAKTKKQLIEELADLRQSIAELEAGRIEGQRAGEQLRQLATRHEAILSEIPDIIMEVDTNKVYTWANPAGYEFFGSDVIGKEASFYFEGEQETYAQMQPLFNGDPNLFYVESWQRRRDGQRQLLAWWCRALKGAQGRVTGALSTARDITDLHRTEQAIRDSEERYRAMVEQSPDGIFLEDVDTRSLLEANPAFQNLLGYTPEEIPGLSIYDIVAADREDMDRTSQRILRWERPFTHERKYRRKDGSLVEVWLSSKVISYAGTEVVCTLVRDLTERKQAEGALHASEVRYRSLFDNMVEGFAYCRMLFEGGQPQDYIYLEVNEAFQTLSGLKNVTGRKVSEVIPGIREADPELFERCGRVALTGQPERFEIYLAALEMWFSISVYCPEKEHFVAVFDVITERKRAEEALQQRAGEIAALNSLGRQVSTSLSLNDVVKAALDGVVDAAHPDLALLFLQEGDRLVLRSVGPEKSRFAHPETPVHRVGECLCWLAASEGKPIYSSDIHRDPRCTWEECKKAGVRSLAALPLHGGEEILGVLALAAGTERDFATQAPFLEIMAHQIAIGLQNALLFERVQHHAADLDRRVRERTAQLEAANQELEAFSYSVSHDLRAPLRHIHGFAQLLTKRAAPALDEKARHHLTLISDSAGQMSRLIDDLLAFSRMGRAKMQKTPVDLSQLVSEIREESESEAKGRKIHWTIAPLPTVWGDPAMLRLVFSNLLSNAIKFTRPRDISQIEIGSLPEEDSEVIVYIRDNGVGFDMRYADKLFGVFQRLHSSEQFEGTGIGLASVRRIIHRHGGRAWAEGDLDAGATFYVSFPQTKQGTP